jgi:hypothetical protein
MQQMKQVTNQLMKAINHLRMLLTLPPKIFRVDMKLKLQ